MKSNLKFFKNSKILSGERFFQSVLYDKKFGYYTSKNPFGKNGDFITSPKISKLFSEIIAVWIVSTWEIFGKPKNFNIVELGPGDGSLIKEGLEVFKKFPKFNLAKKIFLYEKSSSLRKKQKEVLKDNNIKWISDFNKIKEGPIVFFGNEFFDAIPIQQFKRNRDRLLEKHYILDKKNRVSEFFKNASKKDFEIIKSYKSLNKLKFIEFPKSGLKEMRKIVKKILELNGCILMIDYGYIKSNNQNTLQSVKQHKKNELLKNLGKADITSHVNFNLLTEFFLKENLKVKKIVTQKEFLQRMGIMKRAEIISRKLRFREKTNLYLRLKRLISSKMMGNLFKVILAYKFNNSKFYGFN